jgi:hypothetical protein
MILFWRTGSLPALPYDPSELEAGDHLHEASAAGLRDQAEPGGIEARRSVGVRDH